MDSSIGPNLIEQHADVNARHGQELGKLAGSLRIELDAADYHATRFSGYSSEAVAARADRNRAEIRSALAARNWPRATTRQPWRIWSQR